MGWGDQLISGWSIHFDVLQLRLSFLSLHFFFDCVRVCVRVCVCVCVCVLLLTWLTNERVDESMKAHYSFTLMSFESRHWGSEQTLKGGRNDDDDDAADDNDD